MIRALNLRKLFLFLGDVILAYFALFLTVLIGFWGSFNWALFSEHLLGFSMLYFLWLLIFYIFGLYDLNLIKTRFDFYPRLLGALLTSLGLGMTVFYLIPLFSIAPKTNLVLDILIFGALIFIWRKLFYFLFASLFLNKVAIIGKTLETETLATAISKRPYLGYRVGALLDENQNLLLQIQENKIDTLILADNLNLDFRLIQSLYQVMPTKIDFLELENAYEIICEKIPLSSVSQTWFLENAKKGRKELYDQMKQVYDLFLSSIILLLSSPLWILIALAIKLEDKGPVFYSQERVGKDRKTFLLRKFRSMRVGAEKAGAVWAKEKDPRVTNIGKFLRRTHLDELPQMLNVLKGDLNLVGPRPERPEFVQQLEQEIPHYHLRHLIKPGFSGWAQIKFRYARSIIESKEKFQYDLYYVKNRSFLLDMGILLKTFQLFLKK